MIEETDLVSTLLRRWRWICDMVLQENEYKFDSSEESDRIIQRLISQGHYFTISDDQVTDVGWPMSDWGARLAKEHLDCVLWEGEWYDLEDWEMSDLGQVGIIQKCYERFPHVDTTVFAEFDLAALALIAEEDEASSRWQKAALDGYDGKSVPQWFCATEFHCLRLDGDESYRRAKLALSQARDRTSLVAHRIYILEAEAIGRNSLPRGYLDVQENRQDYLDIEIELTTVSRPGIDSVDLTPAELKLFVALCRVEQSGIHHLRLIPKIAKNDERLRGHLKQLRRKLRKLNLAVEVKSGVWKLEETKRD